MGDWACQCLRTPCGVGEGREVPTLRPPVSQPAGHPILQQRSMHATFERPCSSSAACSEFQHPCRCVMGMPVPELAACGGRCAQGRVGRRGRAVGPSARPRVPGTKPAPFLGMACREPDSCDLPEDLPAFLRALDRAARCSICNGLYQAPLLLRSCGHTFCSGCIRGSLDYQERSGQPACPSCRQRCDARDLIANAALRDMVEEYAAARAALADATRLHAQTGVPGVAEDVARRGRGDAAASRQAPPPNDALRNVDALAKRSRSDEVEALGAAEAATGELAGRCGGSDRAGSDSHAVEVVALVSDGSCASSAGGGWSVESSDAGGACADDVDSQRGADRRAWKRARSGDAAGRRHGASAPAAECTAVAAPAETDSGRDASAPVAGAAVDDRPADVPAPAGSAPQGGTDTSGRLPPGFVLCPVCSRRVPEFYINSHVDACLQERAPSRGATAAGGEPEATGAGSTARGHAEGVPPPATINAAFAPLPAPPKLVPALTSEKALRALLPRHGLPCDGRKAVSLGSKCVRERVAGSAIVIPRWILEGLLCVHACMCASTCARVGMEGDGERRWGEAMAGLG